VYLQAMRMQRRGGKSSGSTRTATIASRNTLMSSDTAATETDMTSSTGGRISPTIAVDEGEHSHEPQKPRSRRGSRKAQQEYLECLEALSNSSLGDNSSSRCRLKKTHKQRRSVSFKSASTVYEYEDALSDEEFLQLKERIWYTEEDEEVFKAAARKEVAAFKRLQKGKSDNNVQQRDLCIVGLEQHLVSPDYTKKRARTKKLITYAVLGAQAREASNNPERIAKAARRYSDWSVEQAKKFGDFQRIQSED
jgi:hypothetical protein